MRSQLCGRSGLDVTGHKATSWSLSEETPTERMASGQLKMLKSNAFSLPKDSMLKAMFAAIAAAAALAAAIAAVALAGLAAAATRAAAASRSRE